MHSLSIGNLIPATNIETEYRDSVKRRRRCRMTSLVSFLWAVRRNVKNNSWGFCCSLRVPIASLRILEEERNRCLFSVWVAAIASSSLGLNLCVLSRRAKYLVRRTSYETRQGNFSTRLVTRVIKLTPMTGRTSGDSLQVFCSRRYVFRINYRYGSS